MRVPTHSLFVRCSLRMSGIHTIFLLPLDVLAGLSPGRGRLAISLTAGLVCRAESLFLLIEHIAAALHPVICLFAGPASLLSSALAAFLRLGTKHVAHFIAGARRI